MSAQENTRLVRQAYQSIQAGDMQSFLNALAEDVQWQLPEMKNVPFAGMWRGHRGVEQFFGKVSETQEVIEFEAEEFIAQGDRVVVLGRFFMRVKATGKDSRSAWAHVWTIRQGRVTHFREYVDTAAVIDAHAAEQSGGRLSEKGAG